MLYACSSPSHSTHGQCSVPSTCLLFSYLQLLNRSTVIASEVCMLRLHLLSSGLSISGDEPEEQKKSKMIGGQEIQTNLNPSPYQTLILFTV